MIDDHGYLFIGSKLERGGPEGDCLEWQGYTNAKGYGLVRLDGRNWLVHRYVWEYEFGPVPEGKMLDHDAHCGNRRCARLAHLELVDAPTSVYRSRNIAALNAGKTVCKNGHPFTDENTYRPPKNPTWRICRVCMRAKEKRYLAKRVG